MGSRLMNAWLVMRTDSSTRRPGLLVLLALALACVPGCGDSFQREYVYTRQDPALGRRSPTIFVVRISIDRVAKSVVWVEDVRDNDGDLGRNMETWTGCTFLDDNNWECEPVWVPIQGVVNHIQMRDGQLHQKYWTEDRTFRVRRRILGISF